MTIAVPRQGVGNDIVQCKDTSQVVAQIEPNQNAREIFYFGSTGHSLKLAFATPYNTEVFVLGAIVVTPERAESKETTAVSHY